MERAGGIAVRSLFHDILPISLFTALAISTASADASAQGVEPSAAPSAAPSTTPSVAPSTDEADAARLGNELSRERLHTHRDVLQVLLDLASRNNHFA
jgi:hypothetical protein